jgi:hypothetical protein
MTPMDELPPGLRDLIAEARLDGEPSEDDARRVATALSRALPAFAPYASLPAPQGAVDAVVNGTAQTFVSGAAKSGSFALTATGTGWIAAAVLGAAAAIAIVATRPSPPRARTPAAVSAPARALVPVPVPVPAPAPAPALVPVPASAPIAAPALVPVPLRAPSSSMATHGEELPTAEAPTAVPSAPATPLRAAARVQDELALIRAAARALRADDPGLAQRLLQQHAERFPAGVLAQERMGLTALALCAQGQPAEGAALRERFLKEAPKSPLAARVRDACR